MGYYTIRIFPEIQHMTTIVTEFGKFRYNRLPTWMCASIDILQDKVEKMFGDIYGIKTYIGGILVLSKEIFSNRIE